MNRKKAPQALLFQDSSGAFSHIFKNHHFFAACSWASLSNDAK